jgi:SAM-dependent methyltransferase
MIDCQNKDAIEEWIHSQDWYQTIDLSNGLVTPGKFDTRKRLKFLTDIDFKKNKRVLDVGCNSGQYCLFASKRGAIEVVGIDIFEKRLEQAKTLAAIEKTNIKYFQKSIFEISDLGKFDIVFCFAVLTEISDFFGAVEALKTVVGNEAFIELDLAKPVCYISTSINWLKKNTGISRFKAVSEVRKSKHGWMISPSLEILEAVIGKDFKLKHLGRGARYEMVKVTRLC